MRATKRSVTMGLLMMSAVSAGGQVRAAEQTGPTSNVKENSSVSDSPGEGASPVAMWLKPWSDQALPPAPPHLETKPPSSDPHDLTGVWRSDDIYRFVARPVLGADPDPLAPGVSSGFLPYNARGKRIFFNRLKMNFLGVPVASNGILCRPTSLVFLLTQTGFPTRLIQDEDRITQFFGADGSYRTIFLNGKHPQNLPASYFGHSIGHWQNDTLVVDTVGFNGTEWVDEAGSPSSTRLHVVEHIRKSAGGKALEISVRVEDEVYYSHPFTLQSKLAWSPQEREPDAHCTSIKSWVVIDGTTVFSEGE